MTTPIIECRNLQKWYSGVHALKGVSGEWRLYALRTESDPGPESRSARSWVPGGRKRMVMGSVLAAV